MCNLPGNITKVFLVLGGDHGQGAFRLCFHALLVVVWMELPLYKTKTIGKVYCTKEEGTLLDKSSIPWLDADLERIKDSQLVVTQNNEPDNLSRVIIVCEWQQKILPLSPLATGGTVMLDTMLVEGNADGPMVPAVEITY